MTTDIDPEGLRPSDPTWHIGLRDRYLDYPSLHPGLLVPPRTHWTAGYGQLILEVTPPDPGFTTARVRLYDYDSQPPGPYLTTISTAHGLPCPEGRREDVPPEHRVPPRAGQPESTRAMNWHRAGIAPLASDVQFGDVLPPRIDTPFGVQIGPQRVTRVSMSYEGRLVFTLRDKHSTKRYTFHPEERVEFPRSNKRAGATHPGMSSFERDLARARARENVTALGWKRNPETGQVFRFIKHPYGRGQWPVGVLHWHPLLRTTDGSPLTCRPPEPELHLAASQMQDLSAAEIAEFEARGVPCPTPSHLIDVTSQVSAASAMAPTMSAELATRMAEAASNAEGLPADTISVPMPGKQLVMPAPLHMEAPDAAE